MVAYLRATYRCKYLKKQPKIWWFDILKLPLQKNMMKQITCITPDVVQAIIGVDFTTNSKYIPNSGGSNLVHPCSYWNCKRQARRRAASKAAKKARQKQRK